MAEPTRDSLIRMYELMALIRATDEKLRSLIMSGQAMMLYYSARNQEVIPAALAEHVGPDDYLVTTYRGLHDQIANGVPLRELLAEFLGRATGPCKGKGGSFHLAYPDTGLMLTTAIIGGGLPIANGLAVAAQLRGEDRVTVCNFGDGSVNIGGFHEALNLAALWKLPVVFVCQNNGWAEHTRFENGTSIDHIAERASAYRMPGVTIDGNDPYAMYAAAGEAIARARAGDGPTLLEAVVQRPSGHYVGEDCTHYMSTEDIERAVASDPVPAYRAWLVEHGHASEEDLAALEKQIEAQIQEAVEFALGSPFPDPSEIRRDVYAHEVAP